MYRIELSPGEETALRSIEELATGIRNGVITPRARIWHNASQKWLPIEFHPHYRLALNHQAAQAAATDAAPPAAASAAAPAAVEKKSDNRKKEKAKEKAAKEKENAPSAKAADEPEPGLPRGRRRRSARRPFRLALIGSVLVLGTDVVLSATVPSSDPDLDLPPAPHAIAPRPRAVAPRPTVAPRSQVDDPAAAPPATKPLGGGVVRGPGLVAPPPLSAAAAEAALRPRDSVPAIAPAPAGVTLVPTHLSTDSLGLPSKVAVDSAGPSGIRRVLDAIAPKP